MRSFSEDESCGVMELEMELRESFREVDLVYELLFSKYHSETQFSFDMGIAFRALPRSSTLMNVLFEKLRRDANTH